MWLDIAVALIVLAIFSIAGLVLARSSHMPINRSFSYFSYLMGTWIAVNYIGANFKSHDFSKYFAHADLFTGALLAFSFWIFSLQLLRFVAKSSRISQWQRRYQIQVGIVTALIGASTLFPWSVKIVMISDQTIISYGPGFSLYAVTMLGLLSLAILNSFMAVRWAKGDIRRQLRTMIRGLAVAVMVVAVPNLLIPFLTTSKQINLMAGNIAYLGIIVFVTTTYYSIIVHKLFDIRLIVARTVAYGLSVGSFTLLYVAATLLLSLSFFRNYHISSQEIILTTLLTLFVTITINPVRRFFDKRTNRWFYRDAYDPQTFLSHFNQVLVANYGIAPLLQNASKVIDQYLKPSYSVFVINQSASQSLRISGSAARPGFTIEDIELINKKAVDCKGRIISIDLLDDRQQKLQKLMHLHETALLVKLTVATRQQAMGYLLLGAKKSGAPYSGQDINIIEILSDELVIAIQNALRTEEIENFNVTLQEKVNQATRKLRNTNQKLRQLDEAKDDFVSMASHQLRTPLTSIKGYTSMVLEGDAGDINDTQRKLLEQSFLSSQRMVYLIADLLNVSRLKTGKFIIEQVPVNLADVVQQEIGQLTEVAQSRSLTLSYQMPESFPTLLLDETKTRQVIMNFVDNAIYYTPAGGHIEVKLVETPASVELRVVDDGIGVPKTEQPHLFTKFYRAGNARTARPDGTGLGLFMAKKVIVAEGGALLFESQEGKGSTFGFVFSKTKMVAADTPELATKTN